LDAKEERIPMKKSVIVMVLTLVIMLLTDMPALAVDSNVIVEEGLFFIGKKPIPANCFQRLMTELNGDDVTRSIYLTRSSVRGCINSNEPGRDVEYKILADKGDDIFEVRVCERVDGSMGADCSTLIVRFTVYPYILGDKVKNVLSLDKLGEK
jgi:hypothetical protein